MPATGTHKQVVKWFLEVSYNGHSFCKSRLGFSHVGHWGTAVSETWFPPCRGSVAPDPQRQQCAGPVLRPAASEALGWSVCLCLLPENHWPAGPALCPLALQGPRASAGGGGSFLATSVFAQVLVLLAMVSPLLQVETIISSPLPIGMGRFFFWGMCAHACPSTEFSPLPVTLGHERHSVN